MQRETNKLNIVCNILMIILWVLLILLFIMVGVAYICPFASEILADRTIFIRDELTEKELMSLTTMVSAKKIYPLDFVIERIVSFYELLITYILGLFVVTGLLGYLYIRKSNKADIQDEVYTVVHSRMFSDLTGIEVKRIFSEEKKEGGELYKISGDIENLVSRIEFLEADINNKDIVIKVRNNSKKSSPKKKENKG